MRILSFVILLFLGVSGFTQGNVVQIFGTIRDDDSGKPLDAATIEVFQDGKSFENKTCASNGKIPAIDLPLGHSYTIYVKKAGYVTKMVTIDAHHAYPEDLPPILYQELQSGLFKIVEGVDFAFLETTPMIEFKLDESGLIGYDKDALQQMKVRIEKLKLQMETQKQENLKNEQLEAQKTLDYNNYIKAGDAAMVAVKYEVAITQYEAALLLKPADPIATQKLADAKQKLKDKQKADGDQAAYSAKIEAAKVAYTAKKLEEALVLYKEALALRPADVFATSQITLIEAELKKQKDAADQFNSLVSQGDVAMTGLLYDDAITKYTAALALKPGDVAVTAKLAEAKKQKLAKEQADLANKEKEAKYLTLITAADAAFSTQTYDVAKAKYTEALTVKPGDAHATQRLKDIEAALLKKQQDLDAANLVEANYKKAMAEGLALFNQKTWESAKLKYTEALTYKANDATALAQIAIINQEIEKQAGEAKKNAEYTTTMAEAKALFDQKKYAEAKVKYYSASTLKPSEQLPKDQIALIEKLIADGEKQAQLEKDYQNLMTEGNSLKDIKDYTAALDRYNKALVLKPADPAATTKIAEINKIFEDEKKVIEQQKLYDSYMSKAQAAFNTTDYSSAKMNYQEAFKIKADPTITAKIKEIDDLIAKTQSESQTQAKYETTMKDADALYQAGNLEGALAKYREAGVIKPTELLPKQKVSELEEKLASQKDQAAKDKLFNDYAAAGDAAMLAKDYQKALASYQEALKIKPEPAISQKITTINGLITQQSQSDQVDAKYKTKIGEADAAFTAKNWDLARQLYNDAKAIKGGDTYPDAQIAEIQKRMQAETDAEMGKKYQEIIVKADGLKAEERFDEAIVYYQNALNLKPSDPYPKAQIEAINKIKTDRANTLSTQQKLDAEYAATIKAADEAFYGQNYTLALAKYKEALIKKPADVYATNKITEINGKLSQQTQQQTTDDKYNALITQANTLFEAQSYLESIKIYKEALLVKPNDAYATNQIEEATRREQAKSIDEVEVQYQKILTLAQKKFEEGDYTKAIELYSRAKSMKASDPLPQQRIDEINQILKNKAGNADYDAAIKEADAYFNSGNLVKALESYKKALTYKEDAYPRGRVNDIERTLKDESVTQAEEQYQKIIKKANDLFVSKDYVKSLEYYNRALSIKPGDLSAQDRVKEIDCLINPEHCTAKSGDLVDYGDPINSTEVEVEALLLDSDLQREFLVTESVVEQRTSAEDENSENSTIQENENFDTEGAATEINLDVEDQAWTAEVKRTEATIEVIEMEYQLDEVDRERARMNENETQLQNQSVININTEIEERDEENDLPREEYLEDVERINIEVENEGESNANDQTNVVYDAKEEVNKIQEEHVSGDPNNDIDRLNGEVYVEDMNITLINANADAIWEQEDATMKAKEETEVLVDERISSDVGSDIPREEGINELNDYVLDKENVDRNNSNSQYDATIDQKIYGENMSIEIEENSLGNDIPRQKMEVVVENAEIEIEDNLEDLSADQISTNYKADESVENFEIVMENDRIENDKNREDYEEEVVVINEDISDRQSNLGQLNEDNSFDTEDYTDGMTDTKTSFEENADSKSTKNADNTNLAVEALIEENKTISDGNQTTVESTEDYIDGMKHDNIVPDTEFMVNELGKKYPEGVTEEIFALKDEDGLVTSYIVRRIVVKNGAGFVYEKTQTKYGGATYTRDGQPIAEYQWTNETEDATLPRN